MKRRNVIALSGFALFYIACGLMLTLNQNRIVYHPDNQNFRSCKELSEAEKITHQGTRMYVKDAHKPVVVLYHGNAGSACDRAYYAHLFAQTGYGYVLVEYTGYSNDNTSASHDTVKNDVHNVISYLQKQGVADVTLVGESIGTGAATYHTTLAPTKQTLLISPFTDLAAVAQHRFWFYPTSILVDNAFNNVANLATYKNKVTIIHGDKDSIIPYHLGQELYASIQAPKQFITIEGAGHNNLFLYDVTYESILIFLNP